MPTAISFLTAFLLLVPSAFAKPVGPTRADYVEAVEPICRSETNAHRTVLQGVEGMITHGRLKEAAPRMLRASSAIGQVAGQLAEVPRPPADVARLKRWLEFSRSGGALLREIGLALRHEQRSKVETLTKELLGETRRANAIVVGFNFNYCRMNPARFV